MRKKGKRGDYLHSAMLFFSRIGINRLIEIRVWKTACFYVSFIAGAVSYLMLAAGLIYAAPILLWILMAGVISCAVFGAACFVLEKLEDRKMSMTRKLKTNNGQHTDRPGPYGLD